MSENTLKKLVSLISLDYSNHNLLYELVNFIVSNATSKNAAIKTIRQKAGQVPVHDQVRFVELVETELLSLHERNFARYRVTPQQFQDWKNGW